MHRWTGIVFISLALLLSGCIQQTTVVKVNPDGSGTLEATATMNASAIAQLRAQMKQMAGNMGGEQNKGQPSDEVFSEADAKARAAKLGDGVTFVKAERIKTDKVEGLKAVYAFTDVTKLKLSTAPSKPKTPGMEDDTSEMQSDTISFKLAKQPNGNALLTAVFSEKKEDPAEKKEGPADAEIEQMMMMKQFLQGLRVSIQVEPATTLVQTNAPAKEGNVVTLMELDFDQIMKDDASFRKFASTKNMSMIEGAAHLKGVAGVKVPTTQEVTIEFTGR